MYDHYIGIDWAQTNMAIARHTPSSRKPKVVDVRSDIADLKVYLKSLKGNRIVTIEETSTAQWLYTELRDCVDKIIVCDPYRNRLLSEGPKNDKIDAEKLVTLLRADLLKPVYHSGEYFWELRKLVSSYDDAVKANVRARNQRSAIFRSAGKHHKTDSLESEVDTFILENLDNQISSTDIARQNYEKKFAKLCRSNKVLRNLKSIPGIGDIYAVMLAAQIISIRRFPSVKHFWSYCGLVKHDKISGGRSYGKRASRYSRPMKKIICHATFLATLESCDNPLRERYEYYRCTKRYSESEARVATRRYLASLIYGILKGGKRFDPKIRQQK